jgi:thymidylate kinase
MSLIILEGPDGAGKSTLITRLVKDFGFPVYRSGGPKNADNMKRVVQEMAMLALDDSIVYLCDRTPLVSELVYSKSLGRDPVMPMDFFKPYFSLPQRIIYCNLNDSVSMLSNMSREFKAHKPAEHTAAVVQNYQQVCNNYDELIDEMEASGMDIFGYDWMNGSYYDLTKWIVGE